MSSYEVTITSSRPSVFIAYTLNVEEIALRYEALKFIRRWRVSDVTQRPLMSAQDNVKVTNYANIRNININQIIPKGTPVDVSITGMDKD